MLDLAVSDLPAAGNVFRRSGLKRLSLLKVETRSHAMREHREKAAFRLWTWKVGAGRDEASCGVRPWRESWDPLVWH